MLKKKIFFFFTKRSILTRRSTVLSNLPLQKEFPRERLTVTSVWLESVIKGGAAIDLVSPNVINFFSSSRRLWIHKPEIVPVGNFQPSRLFASKVRANPALVSLHTKFRLLTLLTINRQGEETLAYLPGASGTKKKSHNNDTSWKKFRSEWTA
jgi:hypothetical protein